MNRKAFKLKRQCRRRSLLGVRFYVHNKLHFLIRYHHLTRKMPSTHFSPKSQRLKQTTLSGLVPTQSSSMLHAYNALPSKSGSSSRRSLKRPAPLLSSDSADSQDDLHAIKLQSKVQRPSGKLLSPNPSRKRRKTLEESGDEVAEHSKKHTRRTNLNRFGKLRQIRDSSDEDNTRYLTRTSKSATKSAKPQRKSEDDDDLSNEVEEDREGSLRLSPALTY